MASLTAKHKLTAACDFIEIAHSRLPAEAEVTIELPRFNPNDIREAAKEHIVTFYHPGGQYDYFWAELRHPKFSNVRIRLSSHGFKQSQA